MRFLLEKLMKVNHNAFTLKVEIRFSKLVSSFDIKFSYIDRYKQQYSYCQINLYFKWFYLSSIILIHFHTSFEIWRTLWTNVKKNQSQKTIPQISPADLLSNFSVFQQKKRWKMIQTVFDFWSIFSIEILNTWSEQQVSSTVIVDKVNWWHMMSYTMPMNFTMLICRQDSFWRYSAPQL